jgi:uncharacterized protein
MPATVITVRVLPRASRDEIAGFEAGTLRVRLKAPPVDGKANVALRRFLSTRLFVPVSQIEIVSGATAKTKRVSIEGLSFDEVSARLTS